MSYIIVAEVSVHNETNLHARPKDVGMNILSERDGYIKFDIRGEFGKEAELTKKVCTTLIDAGFYEFEIRHSY